MAKMQRRRRRALSRDLATEDSAKPLVIAWLGSLIQSKIGHEPQPELRQQVMALG
jgi:hypothetical protein